MENLKEVADLLYKYLQDDLTSEESTRLLNWVKQSEKNRQFFDSTKNLETLLEFAKVKNENLQHIDVDQAWEHLKSFQRVEKRKSKLMSFYWKRYSVAASIFLGVLTFIYFWLMPSTKKPHQIVKPPKEIGHDVLPATDKAVLTLENGTKIILDSSRQGRLAIDGGASIVKKSNGQLVYEKSSLKNTYAEVTYNTVTIPKGGDVVFVTLSDGTNVWMNAASSIRYPVSFASNERKVEMNGEAYFEVAHDATRPFLVQKGDLKVTVLGTHFNVNTYEDEADVRVTVLEGSVKVAAKEKSVIVKPSEQAITRRQAASVLTINRSPNLEEVMAWKNGKFIFNNTRLETIMRQLSRWYNVTVTYQGDFRSQDISITGRISRYSNVSRVLDLLQTAGMIQYTIDNKNIILKPLTRY